MGFLEVSSPGPHPAVAEPSVESRRVRGAPCPRLQHQAVALTVADEVQHKTLVSDSQRKEKGKIPLKKLVLVDSFIFYFFSFSYILSILHTFRQK